MTSKLVYRGAVYEPRSVFVLYMSGQKEKIQREDREKELDKKRLQQDREVIV